MDYQTFLEFFGYAASVIVAISLMMSSIIKLRWYNLLGAACFSTYGFLIGALPVGFLNLFIVIADIYYIIRIYREKEYFQLLEIKSDSGYIKHFFTYYKEEIGAFFPDFKPHFSKNTIAFYVLRNMNPAGIFWGFKENDTMHITLDYVTIPYRDFKIGKFLYSKKIFFEELGIKKLEAKSKIKAHNKYLKKMGFVWNEEKQCFMKIL